MNKHVIGKDENSGGDSTTTPSDTSLAVRQFCAAAFGWVAPHSPSQPWRVERVGSELRYCMKCFGVRTFDLVEGVRCQVSGIRRQIGYCRCCGVEVRCDFI